MVSEVPLGRARLLPSRRHVHAGPEQEVAGFGGGMGELLVVSRFFTTEDTEGHGETRGDGGRVF